MFMRRYGAGALCVVVLVGWLVAGTSVAQVDPTTVTLGTVALAVGETTPIEAVIDCKVDGCSAFAITVRYDPAVLRVEAAEIGPYLGDEVLEVENKIDHEAGTVRLAAVVLGAWQEPESDVLFRLNVTGQNAGVTALSVSSLEVADAVGNPTPAEGLSGVAVVETAAPTVVPTDTEPAQPTKSPLATRVPPAMAADDDAFLGPEDAPVVMVEFADFQCPYCARFYDETLPLILEKYPNKVKFVYRDLIIFGEESLQAAMAAECAEEQDAFWAMHDRLFEENLRQGGQVSSENLMGLAEAIGLDIAAFSECMSSQRYQPEVLADYEAAQALGLTGTPSFLINGELVVGAQPFDVFDGLIQAELERIGYELATATPTPDAAACPVPEGWEPYVVQAGDTLFAIYRKMAGDVTFEHFMQANCLTESDFLSVGQVLYVPGPETTPTPAPGEEGAFLPVGSSNSYWTPVVQEFNWIPFVKVPAGCFMMGSEAGGDGEKPVHEVCLSEFWIMQTEVTNTQYRRCVDDGACTLPGVATFYSDPDYADHPVVYVDWRQANDFAVWLDGQLPTEARWEYAARGPEGWEYPWGEEWDQSWVIGNRSSSEGTASVGSRPEGASWVGALDMSGNVWEWVADWYDADYYAALADGAVNPRGPGSGEYRVLRGGSWNDTYASFFRAAYRLLRYPNFRDLKYGFRCARSR
jgi:formylglycine-generating enzyme required for sulfatase activity/protein-disulfide isomerase